MKVVPLEAVPVEKLEQPRTGVFLMQRLLEGEAGSASNFSLELVKTFSDFYSPRHRHNFDQVRLQLEGVFDFHRNGKMTPGMVGYFPEGTPYGPQSSTEDALVLVLQFAGASGDGYMSKTELNDTVKYLRQFGEFKDGAYSRTDETGRTVTKDAYQAVWEHVFKQPLKYPKPRYRDPVMMQPNHFVWTPHVTEDGVFEKILGTFTERRTELSLLRLAPGARHRVSEGNIYFVLTGAGSAGGVPWAARSTLHLPENEAADIEATANSEMLVIGFQRRALPASVGRAA